MNTKTLLNPALLRSEKHKTDNELYLHVRAEQIKALYQQLPGLVVAGPLGAAIFIAILWNEIDKAILISWYAAIVCITGLAAGLLFIAYRRAKPSPQEAATWGFRVSTYAVANGLLWGSTGFLFFAQDSLVYQLFLFLWLWTTGAISLSGMVAYKPAFYNSLLPFLLPLALRSGIEMDAFHIGLSVATLVYIGILSYFYNNSHNTLLESIILRFENTNLVKRLIEQKKEAEHANQAKSQFLAAASHDLRQPLHAQGLFLAELDEYTNHSAARRVLGNLESSVHAMRKLFDAILDISKLDAGIVQPNNVAFPIGSLLEELKLEYELHDNDQGVQLHIMSCSATVLSDPVLLGRILRNYISNALRYAPGGRVLVGCRRHADNLRITVMDTGIGIPEEQRQEIFREFYQLGNSERDREKGLGLGLAIVKRTAQILNHSINVESTLGKGSTFSIDVPYGSPHQAEPDLQAGAGRNDSNVAGAVVLVIDDEASIREGMRGVLTTWGCRVMEASSAQEALNQLADRQQTPDVIIADYRLREKLTGIQAIDRIQSELLLDIPGILITGEIAAEQLHDVNACRYPILHKPVDPPELRSALSAALLKESEA